MTIEATTPEISAVYGLFSAFGKDLLKLLPKNCRETSLALTKCEEACMWAAASVYKFMDEQSRTKEKSNIVQPEKGHLSIVPGNSDKSA